VTSTTCLVSGLTNGTTYTFIVTATNGSGTGLASSPTSLITPYTAPAAPTGLNTVILSPTSFTLSWTTPASNGSSLTGYDIKYLAYPNGSYASVSAGTCTSVTSLTTSCTVTGLPVGSIYQFEIAGKNAAGTGAYASDHAGYPSPVGSPVTGAASSGNAVYTFTLPSVTQGNAVILELGSLSNVAISGVTATGTGVSCSYTFASGISAQNTKKNNNTDTELWFQSNFASNCTNEKIVVTFPSNPSLDFGIVQQWTGLSWGAVTDGTVIASNAATTKNNQSMSTGSVSPQQTASNDLLIGVATAASSVSASTVTTSVSGSSLGAVVTQTLDSLSPYLGLGAYLIDSGSSAAGFTFASGASNDQYSAVAAAFLAN